MLTIILNYQQEGKKNFNKDKKKNQLTINKPIAFPLYYKTIKPIIGSQFN